MSDQNFHEIQLSGKQLVFLFMCVVVFTVVVFLFGVSVGRGVPAAGGQVAQAAPASPSVIEVPSAEAPVSADPESNELSYAEALPQADPGSMPPPAPIAEEPPPMAPETEAPPVLEDAVAPAAAAAQEAPPPALSGWVVQVGAFSANDVAAREAVKLQDKGYPAFVFAEPPATPGPRFKVRVGPYSARADADRMLGTLTREGYKPLLKR